MTLKELADAAIRKANPTAENERRIRRTYGIEGNDMCRRCVVHLVADLEGLSEHAAEHIVAAGVDDDRDAPAAPRRSDAAELRNVIRNAVEVAMSEVLRARLPPEHYSTNLLAALSGAVFGELPRFDPEASCP
jgi:hypothetical protein